MEMPLLPTIPEPLATHQVQSPLLWYFNGWTLPASATLGAEAAAPLCYNDYSLRSRLGNWETSSSQVQEVTSTQIG
jgi:hypothetical protein